MSKRTLDLDFSSFDDEIINQQSIVAINGLRKNNGLLPKQLKDFVTNNHGVVACTETARVTGFKAERGYVYLNLNGGDSWGYYHPDTNADIIYNFKGEPNYRTVELDADYYAEAKLRVEQVKRQTKIAEKLEEASHSIALQKSLFLQAVANNAKFYCMFRDERSDLYFVGYFDANTQTNHFHAVRAKQAGLDYLKQHGATAPDPVPTWNYYYDPSRYAFEFDQGFVNRFAPSRYMVLAKPGTHIPPHIERLIRHATGNDPVMFDHFINWLAFIFQQRQRSQTAWLLQGTTGTGKGLLINKVIRPLLGESNCASITLENLEDQFNAFTESCLFLFVDEVDTGQVNQQQKLVAKLKNWITEPKRAVRGMRQDVRDVANYLNIMMASNQHNSMRIEANDRRFNVCSRQEQKLFAIGENQTLFMQKLEAELQLFANYLSAYQCDENAARTPVENAAKAQLKATTQTAAEEVAEALLTGDLDYFLSMQPAKSAVMTLFDNNLINTSDMYQDVMQKAQLQLQTNRVLFLSHQELFALFEVLVGGMPKTKTKLTKRLNHLGLGLHISPHKNPATGKSQRGVKITWKPQIVPVVRVKPGIKSVKKVAKINKSRTTRRPSPKSKP